MAGIYIHIPFCKQACNYCNFHFSTNKKNVAEMIHCMCKEMELKKNYITTNIETIYFGGGTPSILNINEIDRLLKAIYKNFTVIKEAEITLEANPDDITETNLMAWKNIGINRFSLGIQSFVDEELQWMNRSHNAAQAEICIDLIKKYFNNYSIDLIFGSQILTTENWINNIETALSFNPPHISCYGLTIEEKTKLGKLVKDKKLENINDKKQAQQFEILIDRLTEAGYNHYEISNYAKPNFESQHNSSYWQGKHYLGIGPSAHSFNGISRSWNIANNSLYISSLQKNTLNEEVEVLTEVEKFNEFIMIGLRTAKGISIAELTTAWKSFYNNSSQLKIDELIKKEMLESTSSHYRLTQKGKLFADAIAVELFA